jgi:hypothetical protein
VTGRAKLTRRAFAAILAAGFLSRPAEATEKAPHLPPGFVASSGKLEKPAIRSTGRGGMQASHEFTFRTRPSLPGEHVDLSKLPILEIGPKDDESAPMPQSVPEDGAGDLVVLKTGGGRRLSIRGFDAGVLRVGKALPVATGRQSRGGAPNACGPKANGKDLLSIRYDALRRVDEEGRLQLVWGRALLDVSTCKIGIVSRNAIEPRHVAGGSVYAFRTRRVAQGRTVEELHVLLPQSQARKFDFHVPFEHHTLVLAPGASAAFDIVTSDPLSSHVGWGLPDWFQLVKTQCKAAAVFCSEDVRLEVSQGRGEAVPTAFLGAHFRVFK